MVGGGGGGGGGFFKNVGVGGGGGGGGGFAYLKRLVGWWGRGAWGYDSKSGQSQNSAKFANLIWCNAEKQIVPLTWKYCSVAFIQMDTP